MLVDPEGNQLNMPVAQHWGLYTSAQANHPKLVEAMRDWIVREIENLINSGQGSINSSWFGSRLLETFPERNSWQATFPGRTASQLFGQILWVVMMEDHREWITKKVSSERGTSQRVYELQP